MHANQVALRSVSEQRNTSKTMRRTRVAVVRRCSWLFHIYYFYFSKAQSLKAHFAMCLINFTFGMTRGKLGLCLRYVSYLFLFADGNRKRNPTKVECEIKLCLSDFCFI